MIDFELPWDSLVCALAACIHPCPIHGSYRIYDYFLRPQYRLRHRGVDNL